MVSLLMILFKFMGGNAHGQGDQIHGPRADLRSCSRIGMGQLKRLQAPKSHGIEILSYYPSMFEYNPQQLMCWSVDPFVSIWLALQ